MLRFATLSKVALYNMQADKEEPAGGKPPSFCDRLQRAFHARPAFRPLRRLTVRHQDGGAAKPAAAGAGAGAGTGATAAAHGGPPVPAPPRPATAAPSSVAGGGAPAPTQPVPVRAPTATAPPPGYPVPVPPPGVAARAPSEDGKAGDKAQQTKGKARVGSRVIKGLSSK